MTDTSIAALKVGQEDCILEARMYRKWISKTIPDMKPLQFCCILIDRQNNAVQANMDLNNLNHFNSRLIPQTIYRISNFFCENTRSYQQTLENPVSLKFGRITSLEVLTGKEADFPVHHFEFTSYNQLSSRVPYKEEGSSKIIYPILTDYLGRIRAISNVTPSGNVNIGQKYLRKVDIESLDGNVIEFTMWDEMANQFNKEDIEKLTPPIIIAVSSCRVTKYRNTVQLTATPATHYYINPQTPEAEEAYTLFKEKYNLTPALQVSKDRYADPEQEKLRNRETLFTLLQQNPTSYMDVRFTCKAMITSINKNRPWNYASCSECSKGSTKQSRGYICENHGMQDPVTYRYNFKATVADGTATAEFTFFTHAGQKIIGQPCSELMQKSKATDERELPVQIVKLIGETHIFQIYFAPSAQKGSGQFIVSDVLDIPTTLAKANTGSELTSSSNLAIEESSSEKIISQAAEMASGSTVAVEESSVKEKTIQGTPPRDVIEEVAQTIISTIPKQKADTHQGTTDTSSAPTPPGPRPPLAKRSLEKDLSSEAKKPKKD